MDNLRFLITILLKKARNSESTKGFTLIEILVAMILAFFVITPLLGLAVSLLNTDRQEQAKATSEQEIQAAADFIARDLQQAVFIYTPEALTKPHNQSGIRDQIPPTDLSGNSCIQQLCVPVLAFWKRRPVQDAVPRDSLNKLVTSGTTDPGKNCKDNSHRDECDDTFVYSLVVYYLIRDNPNNNNVWSDAARIGRFEITDGVKALNGGYIIENKSRKPQSDGFQLFDLTRSAPTIADKMNSWEKAAGPFSTNDMQILIDYVDQTPASTTPPPSCPDVAGWSPQPKPPNNQSNNAPGFAVCVNQTANIARVFLRGNARARIAPKNQTVPEYEESQSSYFPRAMAEVRAVGKLVE